MVNVSGFSLAFFFVLKHTLGGDRKVLTATTAISVMDDMTCSPTAPMSFPDAIEDSTGKRRNEKQL